MNALRKARKAKGWSMTKLAEESMVHESTIFRIETGKTKRPHLDTMVILADTLDITVDKIMDDKCNT